MEETMELWVGLLGQYGGVSVLMAAVGVGLLGMMKHARWFARYSESKRHGLYLCLSLGFALIGSGVYLWLTGTFSLTAYATMVTSVYALNQALYTLSKVMSLRTVGLKMLELLGRWTHKKGTP